MLILCLLDTDPVDIIYIYIYIYTEREIERDREREREREGEMQRLRIRKGGAKNNVGDASLMLLADSELWKRCEYKFRHQRELGSNGCLENQYYVKDVGMSAWNLVCTAMYTWMTSDRPDVSLRWCVWCVHVTVKFVCVHVYIQSSLFIFVWRSLCFSHVDVHCLCALCRSLWRGQWATGRAK